jgi:hypothetical protein
VLLDRERGQAELDVELLAEPLGKVADAPVVRLDALLLPVLRLQL